MLNPLYAITDHQLLPGSRLLEAVTQALEGGCRRIQYRDKTDDQSRRLSEAKTLQKLCQQYCAQLIINDDIELARSCDAQGVHLGQSDASPTQARRRLGSDAIVGVTCHASLELARAALEAGADYVAFGRFFPSRTKPEASAAPLTLLEKARAEFGEQPIVAIGGITLDNAAAVLTAGADWLAVSHSLFSAPDIRAQARAFEELAKLPSSDHKRSVSQT